MPKIFSKIDKEVLIILIVVLIVILLIGFVVYRYLIGSAVNVKNSAGGAHTEQVSGNNSKDQAGSQVQVQIGGVQAQGSNGGGSLSVCMDKCGDGICQQTDPNCGKDNNLNCICPETPKECPQDCK